ncbi:MAG: glycosyltransferase family 2 protein [Anaerolineae bacterium]|nr:glycosyltransferase family 2 protein [Chloroflexota bacterium]
MDLGIVIVSYNTCQLTRNCLASVFEALEHESIDGQVWVIDNASADGTPAMVREAFPQAHLMARAENLGFARASNLGIQACQRSPEAPAYTLLLNPDTLVRPQALSHMLSFMDAHPTVGAAGAQLAYEDGSFQHGAFRFPNLWMILFDFWTINHRLINSRLNGRYPLRLYAGQDPFPIDHPLGAALLMRNTTLDQVGLLDEGFFMYCEEIDWCIRTRRAGWQIYCVPQARIVHLGGQSTSQFRERMFVALWQSRFRLFSKHYSPAYRTAARAILRMGLHRRARAVRRRLAQHQISAEAAARELEAYRTVGAL